MMVINDITQAPPSLQKYLFLKRTCVQHTIHEIVIKSMYNIEL